MRPVGVHVPQVGGQVCGQFGAEALAVAGGLAERAEGGQFVELDHDFGQDVGLIWIFACNF